MWVGLAGGDDNVTESDDVLGCRCVVVLATCMNSEGISTACNVLSLQGYGVIVTDIRGERWSDKD